MMLGKKIQQLRKEKGMSQEQLASQLTISRQAISKWELGETVPDTENIVQLTKIFGVSADFLLNDDIDIPIVDGFGEEIEEDAVYSMLKKELKDDDTAKLALNAYKHQMKNTGWDKRLTIIWEILCMAAIVATLMYLIFFR